MIVADKEQVESTEQVQRQPYEQSLEFAVKATIGNLLIFIILSSVNFRFIDIQFQDTNSIHPWIVDGIQRGFLAILAMRSLGKIIASSGFKFSFATKGFKKGMIAHIPMLICIFSVPFILFSVPEARLDVSNALPSLIPRAIFDVGNAVWEEVLWRGVLMTGLLIKWESSWNESATVKKRVAFMLICSFAFGLIHFGGDLGWVHVIFAGVWGTLFSAAYIYSRNLLACSVAHFAVNYILSFVQRMFYYDIEPAMLFTQRFMTVNTILGVLIVIPVAIYLTIKAEPFRLEDIEENPST